MGWFTGSNKEENIDDDDDDDDEDWQWRWQRYREGGSRSRPNVRENRSGVRYAAGGGGWTTPPKVADKDNGKGGTKGYNNGNDEDSPDGSGVEEDSN